MRRLFIIRLCLVTLSWPAGLTCQAMNNDGTPDLLWRSYSSGADDVWAMSGSSHSTLSLPSIPDLNWKIVGTGDFDGDGQLDIVWYYDSVGQSSSGTSPSGT